MARSGGLVLGVGEELFGVARAGLATKLDPRYADEVWMEYVWIVGVSRVGKATLMRALAADAAIRTVLGLGTVEVFAPSLNLQRDLDPHDIVPATRAEHLLIKWQERDREQRVVESLLELRRGERHSFIVLQRHPLQILANWTNSARPYLGSLSAELELIEAVIDQWRNRIPMKFVWAEAGTYVIERELRKYNPTWVRILTRWADHICRWRDRLQILFMLVALVGLYAVLPG